MEKETINLFLYDLKDIIYERSERILKEYKKDDFIDPYLLKNTNDLCNLLLNIEKIEKV